MKLEPEEFTTLRDLIYRATGLFFEDRKLDMFSARVERRMKVRLCRTRREYIHLLKTEPSGQELQSLIEELTTNETYFFRDYPQLESFANDALPLIADAKRAVRDRRLSIWSAACSTGDEPYTLAIILRACLDDFPDWQIRLLATDIDRQVLKRAAQGLYSVRAVQEVPKEYLRKYFQPVNAEFRIQEEVRRMVTFSQVNLMDQEAMRRQRGFDFVFCRNVLIYFDDASRLQVLTAFYEALVPGGFLFLGHAESVSRISESFEAISLSDGVLYRKPLKTTEIPRHTSVIYAPTTGRRKTIQYPQSPQGGEA